MMIKKNHFKIYGFLFSSMFFLFTGAADANMIPIKTPTKFYYIDVSGFHGNGSALWLSSTGLVVAQVATNGMNRIYKFKISDEDRAAADLFLGDSKLDIENPLDRDRQPDEVRVYLGWLTPKKITKNVRIWDRDWDRQPEVLRNLNAFAKKMIHFAPTQKPVSEKSISPGKLAVEWPEECERPTPDPLAN